MNDFTMEIPPAWSPSEETLFRMWYENIARKNGLDMNPDSSEQKYNYRAAYRAKAAPDETQHWPSEYKSLSHPNRFNDTGMDTIFGSYGK